MRGILFFLVLGITFFLFKSCGDAMVRVDQVQREQALEKSSELERARTPDMIPPLAAKPIDDTAKAKAAKVEVNKFCFALGKSLRGKDAELARAMIQRTSELEFGVLKFGHQTAIRQKQIQLGMTPCMALASWGRPERVNRSVGSYGVHEQWVYPANYLYFEDGILTSFQD